MLYSFLNQCFLNPFYLPGIIEIYCRTFLVAQPVENLPAMLETWVRSLCGEDPLEKGTATHSSILAWRIPWTEQSTGLQRVGHD